MEDDGKLLKEKPTSAPIGLDQKTKERYIREK
jgi:hypothetical protein